MGELSAEGPIAHSARHTQYLGSVEERTPGLPYGPFREIELMAVRLPRRGSVDHLADASALPRLHLNLGRDAVLGFACGRRAWSSAIKQQLSSCREGVVCVLQGARCALGSGGSIGIAAVVQLH